MHSLNTLVSNSVIIIGPCGCLNKVGNKYVKNKAVLVKKNILKPFLIHWTLKGTSTGLDGVAIRVLPLHL